MLLVQPANDHTCKLSELAKCNLKLMWASVLLHTQGYQHAENSNRRVPEPRLTFRHSECLNLGRRWLGSICEANPDVIACRVTLGVAPLELEHRTGKLPELSVSNLILSARLSASACGPPPSLWKILTCVGEYAHLAGSAGLHTEGAMRPH